jgi:SAM-dependent methyltransferase
MRMRTGGSDERSGTYPLGGGVLWCALAIVARGRSRVRLPLARKGYGRGACGGLMVRGGVTSERDRAMAVSVTAVRPPRRAVGWFDRWVAQSMPVGAAAFNIGAGANWSCDLERVRTRAGRLVGVVDPSDRIRHSMRVDERYQQSLEQFAPGHPGEFDLAFSVFVVEHVADPDGFARSAAQVLKPGGTLMGLTVNKWHYFGFTTWAGHQAWCVRVAAGQGARRRGLPLPDRIPVQHHRQNDRILESTVARPGSLARGKEIRVMNQRSVSKLPQAPREYGGIGFGELIAEATSWIGVQLCSGCERRAAALDAKFTVRLPRLFLRGRPEMIQSGDGCWRYRGKCTGFGRRQCISGLSEQLPDAPLVEQCCQGWFKYPWITVCPGQQATSGCGRCFWWW